MNNKIIMKKEVKKEKKVDEVIKVRIDGKCEWCGKKGFEREVIFCSEECKAAFLSSLAK